MNDKVRCDSTAGMMERSMRKTESPSKKRGKKAGLLSRRQALSGLALTAAIGGLKSKSLFAAEPAPTVPAQPIDHSYEVLEVGPGKRFPSITLAGAFMNSVPRWNNGYTDRDT